MDVYTYPARVKGLFLENQPATSTKPMVKWVRPPLHGF